MSRNRRRWEEPAPSNWEPGFRGGSAHYRDDYRDGWSHYTPSRERRTFNYWREEAIAPTSYGPRRSYGWEIHDEQWHNDSQHRSSSYARRHDLGPPGRDWDSSNLRSLPYRSSSHQHRSTYSPAPHVPPPTFQARSPPQLMDRPPKPAPPPPPRRSSPPPRRPSEPLKPSPDYLALSDEPSEILHNPRRTRKLLVLDLNGTLLIRSARSRTSFGPQLRPVQPRPYMQSFRQYLFCADTQAWLDTMVWSSAQPHSVADMVDKVFGDTQGELKAVWNRQSLGLSEEEYHRKTVTTKDLTKPWDFFTSPSGPGKLEGRSVISSESQRTHSAYTTLLLDDSPHKAVLQPYNHICIPEYNSTRRQHDLRSFMVTRNTKEGKQSKKAKRRDDVETTTHSVDQTAREAFMGGGLSTSAETESYDATLLAVIGVLEAVKLQSNVAGWIRKGGLWAIQARREEVSEGSMNVELASKTVMQTGNDESSTSDPAVTPEQAHLHTKMWFDDSSVAAYWIVRGRETLAELGIHVIHGVTG